MYGDQRDGDGESDSAGGVTFSSSSSMWRDDGGKVVGADNMNTNNNNAFEMRSLNRGSPRRGDADYEDDDEVGMMRADSLNRDSRSSTTDAADEDSSDLRGSDEQEEERRRYGYAKTTTWQTTANLIKSIVGVGIFALPYAILQSGVMPGLIGLVLIGVLTAHTAKLLIDCKRELVARLEVAMNETASEMDSTTSHSINSSSVEHLSPNNESSMKHFTELVADKTYNSYEDIGRAAWGRKGVIAANFVVISSQLGFCCAYLLFAVENIASILKGYGFWNADGLPVDDGSSSISSNSTMYLESSSSFSSSSTSSTSSSSSLDVETITKWEMAQTACMILPFFILVSWLRDSRQLSHGSVSGIIAIGLGIAAVVYYGVTLPTNRIMEVPLFPEQPIHVLLFFGIAVFSFECINLVVPLESQSKTPQNFRGVTIFSISLMGVVYALFSLAVLSFFAEHTNPVLTLNLPQRSVVVTLVKLLVCLSVLFSYPLQIFPVFKILESTLYDTIPPPAPTLWKACTSKFVWKINAYRTALVVSTAVISLAVPYFGLFVNLVGAFSNSAAAFILPPFFHIKVFGDNLSSVSKFKNVAIIVFGLFASAASCGYTLSQIFTTMRNDNDDVS